MNEITLYIQLRILLFRYVYCSSFIVMGVINSERTTWDSQEARSCCYQLHSLPSQLVLKHKSRRKGSQSCSLWIHTSDGASNCFSLHTRNAGRPVPDIFTLSKESGGEGGGREDRDGNACKSMADSCQSMTKTTIIL